MKRPDRTARAACASLMGFVREERGAAGVEFAMIAPVLLTLWVGFAGLAMGMRVSAQINEAADTMGDIVTRFARVDKSQLDEIMGAAEAIILDVPYNDVKLSMVAVNIDKDGQARVEWAHAANGGSKPSKGSSYTNNVPPRLRAATGSGRFLVRTTASYVYTPPFGAGILGDFDFEYDRWYSPRVGADVECFGC